MIMVHSLKTKMLKDSLLIGKLVRGFFFLLPLLVFLSCAEKVIEPPENLISKDKMIDLLYDLELLNAAKSNKHEALEKHAVETMPYLFDKYGIDSVQFVESDLYYASIPLEYEAIYKTIQERLEEKIKVLDEARKQKNESIRNKSKNIKDSLKNKIKPTKEPVLSKT